MVFCIDMEISILALCDRRHHRLHEEMHLMREELPTYILVQGHSSQVTSLAFAPDTQLLASGAKDRTVLLWNPMTGERLDAAVLHGHAGAVTALRFSPNSKLLASGSGGCSTRQGWDGDFAIFGASCC